MTANAHTSNPVAAKPGDRVAFHRPNCKNTRMNHRNLQRVAVAVAVIVVVTSCTATTTNSEDVNAWTQRIALTKPAPTNLDTATLAAGALKATADNGPAQFTITVDDTEIMSGSINFDAVTGQGVADDNTTFSWTADGFDGTDGTHDGSLQTLLVESLTGFGSRNADNPVLVQQNGTSIVDETDTTVTFLIEGKREAAIQVNRDTGAVTRARLFLAHQNLPDGASFVTFQFDYDTSETTE